MEEETRPWEPYFPNYVHLYNVDYRDDLSNCKKEVAQCIRQNNFFPITEEMYGWWNFPEDYYIDEIKNKMQENDLEWDDDYIEEIRDALFEADKSDPLKDLLRNTGNVTMYYDLCERWGNAWCMTKEEKWEAVDEICAMLQISKDDKERRGLVYSLLINCAGGGYLRIYFNCPIDDVITGSPADFKVIKFKGNYTVSLHDPIEGGGWSEEINLDCEYEFNRDNLQLSEYGDRYSWRNVYGCDPEGDAPQFLMESDKNAMSVEKSGVNDMIAQEEEYERVFKAGDCTYGDTKFTRHRDVYYRNDFPCGDVCPHCGQFWID